MFDDYNYMRDNQISLQGINRYDWCLFYTLFCFFTALFRTF